MVIRDLRDTLTSHYFSLKGTHALDKRGRPWTIEPADWFSDVEVRYRTFTLGFQEVFSISATHGRGMGELLDAVVAAKHGPGG